MATYSSTAYTNVNPVPTHGPNGNMKVLGPFTVTCTAAPSTSDTINFGYAPKGFTVLGVGMYATDMDTNGSPALTLNVGDSGDADRLIAASTIAQTGASSYTSLVASTGVAYQYTTKTLITGVANANAATGAAGTIILWLIGVQADSSTS